MVVLCTVLEIEMNQHMHKERDDLFETLVILNALCSHIDSDIETEGKE